MACEEGYQYFDIRGQYYDGQNRIKLDKPCMKQKENCKY